MSFAVVSSLYPHTRSTALEESIMTATYTFDVFSTLDAFGSPSPGTWGATGASRGPSCSTIASPHSLRSSGWSSGPYVSAVRALSRPRAPRSPSA
jgi:hypothetical protein